MNALAVHAIVPSSQPAAHTAKHIMASRRTAPRSRVNSTLTHQPLPSRPRSVMANQAELEASVASRPTRTAPQDDAETNIQVVIRCRRRSEREIQDNSPIIVSSSGAKSQEVTIETALPQSTLGIVTLPPTRTYPFDLVFGPEADQAMIYHDVVAPMLSEVIQGYNCTLFAYGQTGTGKTYTMQGDLAPTPMGNPSTQAGMVPRVLFRLFHDLEKSGSDYSVKISFVELYNEELRDLLSSELAPPIGSTQPMGQGSGASKDAAAQIGLKIFDDSNKKGVFIQGLEEVSVKDVTDALQLLTKGSQRRQIAATKFNDHSSRSHSVFSITVHIKETSNMGDDLLKVGKLNMVDLAGSENIGRSGAENKRAREAGMINQSLLTLGRVINALVDRSQHVPYRESKLTRLLQDSLGGRTKTCIIATISPARSNMEETLSTLDYAIRAKSIRNKPEVNQRMTRNALLKEYVAEIERLKGDLLAAREKSGIYLSEETWSQLNTEQELRQTELEEAKRQIEIVENQMRAVREEFEQSIALLMKRDGELKMTREQLKVTEEELVEKQEELKVVKGALEEEIVVRKAHEDTEAVLDNVADGLKNVVGESVADVSALFDKLERKTKVFNSNSKVVLSQGKAVSSESQFLAARLDEFIKLSSHHIQKLRAEAQEFKASELETLNAHSKRIDEQLQRLQSTLNTIETQEKSSQEAIAGVRNVLKGTGDSVRDELKEWCQDLNQRCELLCKGVEASGAAGFAALDKALKATGSLVEHVVREVRQYIDAERNSITEALALTNATVDAEITRLREQNAHLMRLLESEQSKGEDARDSLVKRISGLVGEFAAARDRGLKEIVEEVKRGNAESGKRMTEYSEKHATCVHPLIGKGADVSKLVEKKELDGKKVKDAAVKSMSTARTTFAGHLTALQGAISSSLSKYSDGVQHQMRNMNKMSADALTGYDCAKRARVAETSTMGADIQSGYRQLQHGLSATAKSIGGVVERVVSESAVLATATETYHKAAVSHLAAAKQATRLLVEQGAQEDTSTGKTPRKRAWEYVDDWELTESRDVIVKRWREQGVSKADSETFLAEHLPLPDDCEGDAVGTNAEDAPREVGSHEEDVLNPVPASPIAASLTSSSSSSLPLIRPAPQRKKFSANRNKIAPPATAVLSERPTNIVTRRGSRRVR